MQGAAEGLTKASGADDFQEEFHYFSISSVPESEGPRARPAAPGTEGGQDPGTEEAILGKVGLQESNPDAPGGDALQAPVPGADRAADETGRTAEGAEGGPLRSSDAVEKGDLAGEAEDRPGRLSTCLEEEDGRATTRQEDDPSLPLARQDDSGPETQEPQSPDSVDAEAFFDQICHFQSRRMNDQRSSFRKKPRGDDRPWQSAPATPTRLEKRVFFASTVSLQTEQFFDMVAWAQAHRLNDQRADFLDAELPAILLCAPPPGRKKPPEKQDERRKSVAASERSEKPADEKEQQRPLRKQSRRHSTGATGPQPRRAPDQALYDMILTHQSERIEDQRCDPPLTADAVDLFELLLRVQGGRMDEQRTELPIGLTQRKVSPC